MTRFTVETVTPPCLICGEQHRLCPVQGKVQYRSRSAARKHRVGMRSRRPWMKIESAYECPYCHTWHITSLEGGQK